MLHTLYVFCYSDWQDFQSASSAVASKAMRNELNEMIAAVEDPAAKDVRIIH